MTEKHLRDVTSEATVAQTPWAVGGTWLRDLRETAEITGAELAEQVAAPSRLWVEEVEAGLRPVPSSLYRAYAVQFGVPVAEFAAECLRHYDHNAYNALFGDQPAQQLSHAA